MARSFDADRRHVQKTNSALEHTPLTEIMLVSGCQYASYTALKLSAGSKLLLGDSAMTLRARFTRIHARRRLTSSPIVPAPLGATLLRTLCKSYAKELPSRCWEAQILELL